MAEPLALYVHWPFCVSKCPYCDFNSHVRESVDQAVWREALLADYTALEQAVSYAFTDCRLADLYREQITELDMEALVAITRRPAGE